MKPNTSVGCTYTPIWFKRLKNVLPLTLGLLIGTANANAAYVAPTTSETTSINQTKGTVTGKITDNTGEGLVGVTIVVKGTKVRTTTDAMVSIRLKLTPAKRWFILILATNVLRRKSQVL